MKITKQSKQLYQQASENLTLINKTWQNMDNDSVSFIICRSVKECMGNLLSCYLMMKKGKPSRSKSIGDLVNQCAEINEQFKKIDQRWISCKSYNFTTAADVFCNSTQRVRVCTMIANGIKKIIDEELSKANGFPI